MAQPNNAADKPAPTTNGSSEDDLPSKATLALAIQERTGVPKRQAQQQAQTLLDIFDGEARIDDEDLEKDARAFLYQMNAQGIVQTDTVEGKNEQGRDWLYFHWVLNRERIEQLAEPGPRRGPAARIERDHPAAPPLGLA